MSEQTPYRLVQVPSELHDKVDLVLRNDGNHNQAVQVKRLYKAVDIAYRHGYVDGYDDGHTDAENCHDERVRASLS